MAYGGEGGASQVALMVKNPPAKAGDERDTGSIPGLEDPLALKRNYKLKNIKMQVWADKKKITKLALLLPFVDNYVRE